MYCISETKGTTLIKPQDFCNAYSSGESSTKSKKRKVVGESSTSSKVLDIDLNVTLEEEPKKNL